MFYMNPDLKKFVDHENQFYALPMSKKPIFEYGTQSEIILQAVDAAGIPVALNAGSTYAAAIDNNFDHTDDLMAYSTEITADAEAGQLTIRLRTNTESFNEKIKKRETKVYFEIIEYTPGNTTGTLLLQDEVYANPRVMDSEGAPEPSNPNYYTAAQVDALFQARNGVEVVVGPEAPELPTTPDQVIIFIKEG